MGNPVVADDWIEPAAQRVELAKVEVLEDGSEDGDGARSKYNLVFN